MRIVYVRWVDASSDTEEFDATDEPRLVEVETVGHFVREDEDMIVVATDRDAAVPHKYRCQHLIPLGMIKERKFLQLTTGGD